MALRKYDPKITQKAFRLLGAKHARIVPSRENLKVSLLNEILHDASAEELLTHYVQFKKNAKGLKDTTNPIDSLISRLYSLSQKIENQNHYQSAKNEISRIQQLIAELKKIKDNQNDKKIS